MERVIEKYSNIYEIEIGNEKKVKIGGQSTFPMISFEGEIPNKPKLALEITDIPLPEKYPYFSSQFKAYISDPIKWIKMAEEYQPDLLCIRFVSCNPELKDNSPQYAKELTQEIIKNTSLPLILLGCGNEEKDTEIIPAISQASSGSNVLLGMATSNNYRTFVASALADGHSIIAETPIDINLEKQLNILMSDMGMPLERIVIHVVTAGLGYGFEYCYSVMERTRIAGLQGDKFMACPMISLVGEENWKLKEVNIEDESLGELQSRAIGWEICSASGYIQAGSDIIVLFHPLSLQTLRRCL